MASLFDEPGFRIAGDRGLLMEFGDEIAPAVGARVRAMAGALDRERPAGVTEVIPTYRSVIVTYDPLVTDPERLMPLLREMDRCLTDTADSAARTVEIPVCYGGKFGPDLAFVAETGGITAEEVIRIHSETAYPVYMIGFTPGFPYLGGLSEKLHTPRLASPRAKVPAGSVGIANNQTGIYPIDSPGGWQLIGRSPVRLFAPERENPFLLAAGDRLKFKPVSEEEYRRIAEGEQS